jgi:hypothetical protein
MTASIFNSTLLAAVKEDRRFLGGAKTMPRENDGLLTDGLQKSTTCEALR